MDREGSMSRLLRSVSVVAVALSLACCGMVPSLSATSCLRGVQLRPGMTEPQVLALLGKPYGMAFGRGEFRYRWMNNEGGRDVNDGSSARLTASSNTAS